MGRQLTFTVLLADHDAPVAPGLERTLMEAGLEVIAVQSVAHALKVNMAKVDCVLSDISLCGQSTEPIWLEYSRASVPVVIYSGADRRMISSAFPGANIVSKPCSSNDLLWELVKAITANGDPSKRRATPTSSRIGREVASAMQDLSLPMLAWQSETRKLATILSSQRSHDGAYDAVIALLAEVEEAYIALEEISLDLAVEVREDSRFVDRSKSLAALYEELRRVAVWARPARSRGRL